MLTNEDAIRRCIQIGRNGLGTSRPNPMVGALIVCNNKIIGEGFTDPYGGYHAEVNAINAVKDQNLLKSSTLYVTLEPCSHYGKTPPCSDLIVSKGIPKVVVGCLDDNPQVAGRGIKRMQDAGIQVEYGVLKNECRRHHQRFFTFFNKNRPYIILKWAESSDGYIAPSSRSKKQPVWITNTYSRQLVHKWRSEEQAILVGTNTVIQDNPELTVRDWAGQNPTRILYSSSFTTKHLKEYKIFNNSAETLVYSGSTESLMTNLANAHINSIIIEGGAKVLNTFITQNLWDEARVFYGDKAFKSGVKAPKLNTSPTDYHSIQTDGLRVFYND